ncbi:MAG: hypothetical protein Q7J16_01925 [Candidatus Cloacimonadales bacterium]|nr:hypothetical protein [Candidatus Cloacimonadales bacterium]
MLSETQIIELAKQEEQLHPKSSLIDYYKFFFQGTFGPEHFIENEAKAKNFLQQELASATSFEPHLFQKIDYRTTFYRVNLAVIKLKLVSPEDFFKGFLKSSKFQAKISNSEWATQWQQIELILKKSSLKIFNFEEASDRLNSKLEKLDFIISHSEIYRKTYQPHYRLFNQTEFNKLTLE